MLVATPLLLLGLAGLPAGPTTTAVGGDVRFIAVGDTGSGSTAQLALRDRMAANAGAYDFALLTGDGAYPVGSTTDYQSKFFGVYANLFQGYATEPPAPTSGTPKPIWTTPGNHDYDTSGASAYRAAFVMPTGGPSVAPAESYFSFDVNGVHFVSFDSHWVVGWNMTRTQAEKDAVRNWLIADLDANTAKVTVVFDHHPAYTAGDHHGASEETAMRSTWFPLFAAHGVDLLLSGHDHGYQRNTPQSGLTSYVTGGGGAGLYPISPLSYTAASMSEHHYLQVNVTGCTINTVAVRSSGSQFDPWSYTAPTCTTADPNPSGQLFADGFENGTLNAWTTAQVGSTGTAVTQTGIVAAGQYAARLSATSTAGSYAYLRKTLPAADTDISVQLKARVEQEGAAGGNVPLLRLYNTAGTRVLSLYRQNQSGSRLYVQHSGTYNTTSGLLPLATWGSFDVRVVVSGTSSLVEIRLGGTLIHRSTAASLGTQGISTIQVGNETSGQTFNAVWDDVFVYHGTSTPAPTPTPTPTAAPTPTPTPTAPPPTPTPTAAPTATPGPFLLLDTFESGTLAKWSVRQAGAGSVTASAAAAATGSFGARLESTTGANSYAYMRAALPGVHRLTATAKVRVNADGASGGNVPLLRLFDAGSNRVVSVHRQNATGGRLYVVYGGVTHLSSGSMPLGAWHTLQVSVLTGTAGDTLTVRLDGTVIHQSSGATGLGDAALSTAQFGNEVKKQAFQLDVDDVELREQ